MFILSLWIKNTTYEIRHTIWLNYYNNFTRMKYLYSQELNNIFGEDCLIFQCVLSLQFLYSLENYTEFTWIIFAIWKIKIILI